MGSRTARMKDLPAVWLSGTREERLNRLVAYYDARRGDYTGGRSSADLALRAVDHPLRGLAGDCGVIFDALAEGHEVPTIAEAMGVAKSEVYAYLIEHEPKRWARVSAGMAAERLDRADRDLQSAGEQVEVSRLSAISRNSQWMLERMAPRLYGARDSGGGVQVTVILDPSCGGGGLEITQVSGPEASVT